MGGGGNTTDGGDKDKLSTTDKTNEMISDSRKKGSDDVENLDETALTEMNSSKEGSSALTQHDSHHSDYVWLHALYHLIVTTIGTGILGYPYAASYLGFAGAAIFIIVFSAYCYYTALLLVGLQESDYGTYSEIADGVMGKSKGGFSKYTVVPAQYMYFFPMVATMIIVGGTAMSTMDTLANNGKETLSLKLWMVVDAIFVFAFSMTKDLSSAWQISIVGSLAAFLIVGYSVAGSIVALTDPSEMESVEYARPASETKGLEYQVHLMAAFGEIMFGYGFHAVLPDIQASLHSGSAEESRSHMKKAVTGAMTFSATSYLIVAMMGYAAFGVSVNSLLLLDFNDLLPDAAMYTVWVFVAIKTSTEGAVFNQAAFSLTRDLLGMTQEDDQGRRSIDHHPKNWILDFVMKLVWVALATVVAIYLPYFGDLTSITSAISITPMTCLLPVILYNHKHRDTIPKWRLYFHYVCMIISVVIAAVALVGAVIDIGLQVGKGE